MSFSISYEDSKSKTMLQYSDISSPNSTDSPNTPEESIVSLCYTVLTYKEKQITMFRNYNNLHELTEHFKEGLTNEPIKLIMTITRKGKKAMLEYEQANSQIKKLSTSFEAQDMIDTHFIEEARSFLANL